MTDTPPHTDAKKRHLVAKLLVKPGNTVLDIFSGWGGLALCLAEICAARTTGITLSEEQLAFARAGVAEKELSDRVTPYLQDYRDGVRFDRLARPACSNMSAPCSMISASAQSLLPRMVCSFYTRPGLSEHPYSQTLDREVHLPSGLYPAPSVPAIERGVCVSPRSSRSL